MASNFPVADSKRELGDSNANNTTECRIELFYAAKNACKRRNSNLASFCVLYCAPF